MVILYVAKITQNTVTELLLATVQLEMKELSLLHMKL